MFEINTLLKKELDWENKVEEEFNKRLLSEIKKLTFISLNISEVDTNCISYEMVYHFGKEIGRDVDLICFDKSQSLEEKLEQAYNEFKNFLERE